MGQAGIEFSVVGEPIAQPRHRATKIGGKVRMYLPNNPPVNDWKKRIIELAMVVHNHREPFVGPLELHLDFCFPTPKTVKRSGWKDTKPDLDNCIKACMDAMTDANIWEDDKQVCVLKSTKKWANSDETPRVDIRLKPCD